MTKASLIVGHSQSAALLAHENKRLRRSSEASIGRRKGRCISDLFYYFQPIGTQYILSEINIRNE